MKTKFKIGDKVFALGDRGYVGQVVDIEVNDQLSDIIYHVKWSNGGSYPYDEEELRLVDPKAEEILKAQLSLKLRAVSSRFEYAFSLWEEIQDISEKAGASIREFKNDPEVGALLNELENVVLKGGWNSSSLYC